MSNATLVAVSDDRVAVALPDPPRLEVLDRSGIRVGLIGLDVPATDLARPPADGVAAVTTDDDRVYWWTGSQTVALDAVDLTPDWTLPDTLGPAVTYAGELLVPVPAGVAVLAADTGRVTDTLPVPRDDPRAAVFPAVQGEMLLEQRGSEARRPAPVALSPRESATAGSANHRSRSSNRQNSQTRARPPTIRAASPAAASDPSRSVRRSTHTWATTATTAATT